MFIKRFTALFLIGTVLLIQSISWSSAAGSPLANFNGDDYADLAIGAPFEDVGAPLDAGVVNVLYGTAGRLSSAGSQSWHQNTTGIVDASETADRFGSTLAVGDFNGDLISDLAIGVPGESVSGVANAGAVHILYGSSGSLTSLNSQFFTEEILGFTFSALDGFGRSLAAGDFNGDGFEDLAIGVPGKDFGFDDIGMVRVLFGSSAGLTTDGMQTWAQGLFGLGDSPEEYDMFGYRLAAGDFDRNGCDDLVVGVPYEDINTETNAGAVQLIYGTNPGGLDGAGSWFIYQGNSGVMDAAEQLDTFGFSLAVGDFDGNGYDDLAIGAAEETLAGTPDIIGAGAVNVLYGVMGGLTADFDQFWTQTILLGGSASESDDRFGYSLAAGDFNGDGRDDLAVGVAYEDMGLPAQNAGSVNIISGSGSGLAGGSQNWHQNLTSIAGESEAEDYFGYSLAAADFDGDGYIDLAIGVPYEDYESLSDTLVDAGCVHVLYGSASTGLSSLDTEIWWQSSVAGDTNSVEEDDRFGYVLVAIPELLQKTYLPVIIQP